MGLITVNIAEGLIKDLIAYAIEADDYLRPSVKFVLKIIKLLYKKFINVLKFEDLKKLIHILCERLINSEALDNLFIKAILSLLKIAFCNNSAHRSEIANFFYNPSHSERHIY